jgi:hypothetical protein
LNKQFTYGLDRLLDGLGVAAGDHSGIAATLEPQMLIVWIEPLS